MSYKCMFGHKHNMAIKYDTEDVCVVFTVLHVFYLIIIAIITRISPCISIYNNLIAKMLLSSKVEDDSNTV